MNFDFGNVLTRAWQITWKHKTLWALSALPMIVSFLAFPLFILPVYFFPDAGSQEGVFQSNEIILSILFLAGFAFVFIASFVLSGVSMSAATLGVARAERGEGELSFASLLRDSRQYIGRILAVLLIINLTIGLVFTLFFLISFALIAVTMGIPAICLQPIMILITPLSFLVLGVLESAQAAVIVDDMNALDAVKRGLNIVRENIWKYVIITLIIYFGSSIIMSAFMLPLMAPFFAFSFFASSPEQSDPKMMTVIMLGFMCLFFPFMIVFQSIIMTFMKSALCLSYLRLTAPKETAPVFVEANA